MEDNKKSPVGCYHCRNVWGNIIADKKEMRFGCFGADKVILKCSRCNLVQLYPQWTDRELDYLYEKYWQKEDFEGQKRKVKISKYLTKYLSPADKILEVGCGYGDNMRYLRSKGFDVTGIDKAPTELGIQTDYKDHVVNGWDVVYAIHLFEHIADPKYFIRWMENMLNKGGRFILEIPSLNNPLLRLRKFRKFYWYPYHLFFYDKRTIKYLFPNAEVMLFQEYGLINHLRWLFRGKPGNWNPEIPVLDRIYKHILNRLGYGDTLIVVGNV